MNAAWTRAELPVQLEVYIKCHLWLCNNDDVDSYDDDKNNNSNNNPAFLADFASSHMLVSKIKPCASQCKPH